MRTRERAPRGGPRAASEPGPGRPTTRAPFPETDGGGDGPRPPPLPSPQGTARPASQGETLVPGPRGTAAPRSAGPGLRPRARAARAGRRLRRSPAPTRTFPDDFQQRLFLLGQLAFLYVNHCPRQLGGCAASLRAFRGHAGSARGALAAGGRRETRTPASVPNLPPSLPRAGQLQASSGEPGRGGRFRRPGTGTAPPRALLAQPVGGAPGGGSQRLPLDRPGKTKPSVKKPEGGVKFFSHVSHPV